MVAYSFAIPLMIEEDLSPWQALEASRKAVTHQWGSIFGAGLLLYVILFLSIFTAIGLIWAVPMLILGYGVIYQTIFGVKNSGAGLED